MADKPHDLKAKVLLAALKCSGGDPETSFTFEELLVEAWSSDQQAWGLRGFEREHPDSERIHRELDSRGKNSKGLVAQGLLEKVEARVYQLSTKGLVRASGLLPKDENVREKAGRELESRITRILGDATFKAWLRDRGQPKRFRDAGRFWGVAPGTPPKVIAQRIAEVKNTLMAAKGMLEGSQVDFVSDKLGRRLFDRSDVEHCFEFQETLCVRFSDDLKLLGWSAEE